MDAKIEGLEKKEQQLQQKHADADKLRAEVQTTLESQVAMLEKIAGMSTPLGHGMQYLQPVQFTFVLSMM